MHASLVHAVALRETASAAVDPPMTIEALFSSYAGFVWRTLRHFGVAPVDLEDQTQEVFLVAHRRLAQWDGQQARPWLYGIARRCAAAYRRRGHRRHEHPVETLPENSDAPDFAERVELGFLKRVLESLDEDKRSVFLLYEVEEMSMREVAEAVQCPLQTAYSRLHAARREIARALEDAQ